MIPSEQELLDYIKRHDSLVNLSMIANFFGIQNTTASDVVSDLAKKKLVEIRKLGGQKIIRILEKRGEKR